MVRGETRAPILLPYRHTHISWVNNQCDFQFLLRQTNSGRPSEEYGFKCKYVGVFYLYDRWTFLVPKLLSWLLHNWFFCLCELACTCSALPLFNYNYKKKIKRLIWKILSSLWYGQGRSQDFCQERQRTLTSDYPSVLLEDLFADKIEQNLQNNITDKPQRMFILPEAKRWWCVPAPAYQGDLPVTAHLCNSSLLEARGQRNSSTPGGTRYI